MSNQDEFVKRVLGMSDRGMSDKAITMINLAGNKESCDRIIRQELTRCGIEIVEGGADGNGEVPATVTGKLGNLTFTRAWYYWVVKGNVPIEVARELYADVVGKTDIRVNGNCVCPSPDDRQFQWLLPNSRQVIPLAQKTEFEHYGKTVPYMLEAMKKYDFSDDPASLGAKQYIDSYHIDSELGLYIFAQAIKKHGLDK